MSNEGQIMTDITELSEIKERAGEGWGFMSTGILSSCNCSLCKTNLLT